MVSDAPAAVGLVAPALREIPRPLHSAHLVGVGGAGMKALGELLVAKGVSVSGSDLQLSDSRAEWYHERGLRVHLGHQSSHVCPKVDVLVYSPAIGAQNPERQFARTQGIPELSYSQMLGWLMQDRIGVCIAGTHGKSTTTAMTGSVLTSAGLSPTVIVGAELRDCTASGWSGEGEHFIVESCEFNRSFLDLAPTHAAILGIEPDHFDCFASFDETVAAFHAFAKNVPGEGSLLIPHECEASRLAAAGLDVPFETFSLTAEADWWAADVRPTAEGVRFRIFRRGEYFTEIALRIPGTHNALNALAAAALCHHAGAHPSAIREGLAEFQGLRRRFEPVGMWRGVTLIDDYAHHPTAVAVTLRCTRERFPNRRVWCVFQPHQVSRTQALFPEFAESLALADETVVVPVYAARERVADEPVKMAKELAKSVVEQGGSARFCTSLDHVVATLEDALRPGDVLITMGAGDVGQVHHAFTRRLQRHSHAG